MHDFDYNYCMIFFFYQGRRPIERMSLAGEMPVAICISLVGNRSGAF